MAKILHDTYSITGKILEIIKNAKSELFIVSPYIHLSQWKQINHRFKYLLDDENRKDINITIVTRKTEKENSKNKSIEELAEYIDRCNIYLVEDLHSKIYYNRNQGLITSMNLYQHSAENNHEIAVYFEHETKELKEIKENLKYLLANGQKFVSSAKQEAEKAHLEGVADKLIPETFRVLSIGTKWIKVETDEGYENKVLIEKAPGLHEDKWYQADVEKKWNKTPWGLNVEYVQVHNLKKIQGYCIVCGKELPLDPSHPLCKSCYFKNKKYRGNIYGKLCHICGHQMKGITDSKPACRDCFNANPMLFQEW